MCNGSLNHEDQHQVEKNEATRLGVNGMNAYAGLSASVWQRSLAAAAIDAMSGPLIFPAAESSEADQVLPMGPGGGTCKVTGEMRLGTAIRNMVPSNSALTWTRSAS